MKRKVGRYPNIEYYEEILRLPEKELFSPSQVAHRKYDNKAQPELYRRMFHALYRFGDRNGLKDKPDNCLRHPDGSPVVTKGKHQLLPKEGRAKWYGKTWRNALYDDDIPHFKKQYVVKLANVLNQIAVQKQNDIEKVVPMQIPSPKLRKPKMKWLLIALVAIAFTATSMYNYDVLGEGYSIMRQQGPRAALEYFQNRGESYDTLFGKAWAAYRNGDYQQATTLGEKVLGSSKLNDKARANYLLGDLMTIAGEYDQAQDYLLAAQGIYETTGRSGSEFRVLLALSKLYLSQTDKENAEYFINLASVNPKAETNHYFLYLKAQLAFLNNDFDSALEISRQREKFVGDDNSQLADIYSEIGFYSCLIGDFNECFTFTMRSQNLAKQMESLKLVMYNNVNIYIHQKCTMRDPAFFQEAVIDYARKNKDTRIMEYMLFAEKFICPVPRPGPGDLDPPDDPPPDPPESRSAQGEMELKGKFSNDDGGNR